MILGKYSQNEKKVLCNIHLLLGWVPCCSNPGMLISGNPLKYPQRLMGIVRPH